MICNLCMAQKCICKRKSSKPKKKATKPKKQMFMAKGMPSFTHISFKPTLKNKRQTLNGSPVNNIYDSLENQKLHVKKIMRNEISYKDSRSSKSKSKRSKHSSNIADIIIGSSRLEKAIKAYKSNEISSKLSKILTQHKQQE